MDLLYNSNQLDDWNQFIQEGNLDALSRIYFHYYDLLFTYGLKITSDRQIVEDSIQNIFFNCIKSRKNINTVRSLSGYLISSFRRELFNNLEGKRKILFTADITSERFDYYQIQEQDNIDKIELEKLHVVVKQCIGNLSAKQQEILFLRFESEVSYEEIAQMMDISVDSCYKAVYRAVKAIREEAELIISNANGLVLFVISSFFQENIQRRSSIDSSMNQFV